MRCAIIEDEPLAQKLLIEYIARIPFLEVVETFSNPLEALEKLMNHDNIDLLFLDIQMPNLSGMELLNSLKNIPIVIITSAYTDYAQKSYDFDVTDYLLKPITFSRFLRAVERAKNKWDKQLMVEPQESNMYSKTNMSERLIFIKDGTKLRKVMLNEVQYIKGLKDYVQIILESERITTLQTLKQLQKQLPKNIFVRIHHSFIISVLWIDQIQKNRVKIGNDFLPISNSYKKMFIDFIRANHLIFPNFKGDKKSNKLSDRKD